MKPEALPLLARYRMIGVEGTGAPFRIWKSPSEDHWLVVSGVGKALAAAATAWLYARAGEPSSAAWINAGIAGHREWEPGTVRRVGRISESASGRVFSLSPALDGGLAPASLVCVDKPSGEYPADGSLVDMESAGFFAMAERLASDRDRILLVKVVSDNAENPPRKLTSGRARELMEILAEQTAPLVAQLSA